MKFSAQEEYGLRCLLVIAKHGAVTIPEISREEGLTEPHVAKLLMILRKGGFITSTRGQLGGYVLARNPAEIVVGHVLSALGGRLYEDGFCDKHAGRLDICARKAGCSIKNVWSEVQEAVDKVLNNITLADLMKESVGVPIQLYAAPPEDLQVRSEIYS